MRNVSFLNSWLAGFVVALTFSVLSQSETSSAPVEPDVFGFNHENILGTTLGIQVRATSQSAARDAESRILFEIERLSGILSSYAPESEFNQFFGKKIGTPVLASSELRSLFEVSEVWNRKTSGVFDIRMELLSKLWADSEKAGKVPDNQAIEKTLSEVRKTSFHVDQQAQTIQRQGPSRVNFNAIATGTIVDLACEKALLNHPEILGVMIDIGGDIKVLGDMEIEIGVAHPRQKSDNANAIARLQLTNSAVTTSGDLYRGFDIGGKHYSHIIDPRTGRPVVHVVSATVVAPSAEMADVLATSFNVMEIHESLQMADSIDGVACLLVSQDGRLVTSRRWGQYAQPSGGLKSLINSALVSLIEPSPVMIQDQKSELLPLEVQFEINQPDESRRYRRPYVAVWVEDKDGYAVRTLALWLQARGERWHPDLRRWYRDDQTRRLVDETNLIQTIAKPTRPPGKYNVVWNGLDDAGEPVKPGVYTILIEAAREHGTYQLIRQEMQLGDKPVEKTLTGNVEIKSGRLIYGKNAGK